MNQEKTILEWLQQAKAGGYEWADAAIANCRVKSAVVESMAKAVYWGFVWGETPEGGNFWLGIHIELSK